MVRLAEPLQLLQGPRMSQTWTAQPRRRAECAAELHGLAAGARRAQREACAASVELRVLGGAGERERGRRARRDHRADRIKVAGAHLRPRPLSEVVLPATAYWTMHMQT